MPSETDPKPRQPFAIRLAIAVMALVALFGIAMIGNGLYIMAKAEFARISQNHAAQQHLADFRVIDPKALESASEI